MKKFVWLSAAAVAALLIGSGIAEAGRGCGCCGGVVYAPVAASPAAAAHSAPTGDAVAQAGQGYRSYSYQPAAAAPAMSTGGNYYYSGARTRNYGPVWMNGANKSLGRVN